MSEGRGGGERERKGTEREIEAEEKREAEETLLFSLSENIAYERPLTGDVLWSYTTNGIVRSSPAVDKDLSVYFGSYDFFVYKVMREGKRKKKHWG